MAERTPYEIAGFIAEQVGDAVAGIVEALPYEPTRFTNQPLLAVFFSGFERSSLESPSVQGDRVIDPIGGRTYVWLYTLRLFVDLKADGEAAQVLLGDLTLATLLAIDADPTLGTANLGDGKAKIIDTAVASGRTAKVEPRGGGGIKELLMEEMDCAVEITEEV